MSDERPSRPAQSPIWEGEGAEIPLSTPRVAGGETTAPPPKPRSKAVNRQQMTWAAIDVEQLVPPDHLVRAIWELTGQLDLRRFWADTKAVEGVAGCSPYDPRLLISLWVLAYSDQVSSAREVARRCAYHPAYQWLTGLSVISHRTLSGFRVEYKEELDELFAQVLAVLRSEEMITLERVMQDGTKVKAAASPASFHREAKLRQHLEEARARVVQMGDPQQDGEPEPSRRQQQAQARAAQEKVARMEAALEELKKVQAEAATESKPLSECRVSESEPQARKMKQASGGGFAPSYNVQLVTDAAQDIIVGVRVVKARNDQQQLEAGLEKVERQTGTVPRQAVVDEGYLSRATVLAMEQRGVDLIAGGGLDDKPKNSVRTQHNCHKRGVTPEFYPETFVYDAEHDHYLCPAGQELPYRGVKHDREGVNRHQYRAKGSTCRSCPRQAQCCPSLGKKIQGRTIVRTENVPVVAAFVDKMKTPEAQAIYRERKRIAEFPNLWLKEKLGLRRFRVRGLLKATCEAIWACLTYNIQQWARQRWKPKLAAAA
jgi:transposase